LIFSIDFLKGFLTVLLSNYLWQNEDLTILTALVLVIGNIFSIFLGLKGGKGVATSAGVLFYFEPVLILCLAIFQISSLKVTKIMSISTFSTIILLILVTYFTNSSKILYFTLCLSSLVIFAHRENIRKLINKTENGLKNPKN